MIKAKKKKVKRNSFDMPVPVKFDEAKYKAECDARTLADAKMIQADRKRVNAACAAAKRMAAEKMKEANAIGAVASRKKK